MAGARREIMYSEAISEALIQAMEADPKVFIMGVGVDDPKGIFGTTLGPYKAFGAERVLDVPLSENAIAGVGVGAALSGMRPVIVHARDDFLLLTMDQLANNGAKWRYMSGGQLNVPLTVRAIIGRGWGQAAQHSQSLHALFAHVPGLKVVMPTTPADVKGLTIASIQDENPVIILEHRWLYGRKGHVPAAPYSIPLGKGAIAREGSDVTVVAFSLMAEDALEAASLLEKEGIGIEVIDLRSIRPWDEEIVFQSAAKTGRLLVLDGGWLSFGVSAEIAARAGEELWGSLKAPPRRVALPDTPTPCSPVLEAAYYPGPEDIASAVRELLHGGEPKAFGKDGKKESAVALPGISDSKYRGPF